MSTRIYQAIPLSLNATIILDEKASHHLARVLRSAVGETVTIFNGEGGEYEAEITAITKKNVTVMLKQFHARDVESPLQIHLAQGIARGEKMDFIIQKAVELGVSHIIPLITERCNVRLDNEREEKRLQHWHSVVISACEQSGRNRLPQLARPQSLSDWLTKVQQSESFAMSFVLSPYVKTKLTKESPRTFDKPIALLLGPEGGLSDQEIALAEQQHFSALNLGPRVLRTETATLAAVSVLQFAFGDFASY
jgi:16S rRNA (uracil1498-N3)-methyltransferase